ncbi:MAG: LysM peptidoglycan-binding domain-containing protein, partial [Tumebacillaceae bacterium]
QVGVTLEHLKAANPQVPNPDKIYPGQVLNIPSSGMKLKSGNPGSSLKEQLTAPMAMQPFPKEQLLKPKEMAPMEKMPPTAVSPAMEMPMPPMPMMPAAPAPLPIPDINLNLQYAPHKHHAFNYAPQKEIANNFNTNIGNFPYSHTTNTAAAQQQQQSAPIANTGVMPPVVSPMAVAPMHQTMLYYIPVSIKKKKKHHKCHKKAKKCGCHKKHHHHPQQLMMQHMGMFPKTFYREED